MQRVTTTIVTTRRTRTSKQIRTADNRCTIGRIHRQTGNVDRIHIPTSPTTALHRHIAKQIRLIDRNFVQRLRAIRAVRDGGLAVQQGRQVAVAAAAGGAVLPLLAGTTQVGVLELGAVAADAEVAVVLVIHFLGGTSNTDILQPIQENNYIKLIFIMQRTEAVHQEGLPDQQKTRK